LRSSCPHLPRNTEACVQLGPQAIFFLPPLDMCRSLTPWRIPPAHACRSCRPAPYYAPP
jgi:hypothetical protein